jgi:hypothetical protein
LNKKSQGLSEIGQTHRSISAAVMRASRPALSLLQPARAVPSSLWVTFYPDFDDFGGTRPV